MEFGWEAYYSQEQIKRIQQIELESLDVFINLCKQLKINFYLYGGSIIGAIKYQGFVPWDDDLDIALLREDYEFLIKEGPNLLPDGYEIQSYKNNRRMPFPYVKFRRNGTVLVEYGLHNLKINHGIYFDIYPLDNIPDDDIELCNMHKKYQKMAILLRYRQAPYLSKPITSFKDFLKTAFLK